MDRKLEIRNVVRVIGAYNLSHHHLEGQVVGFDPNNKKRPVRVWFGREADKQVGYPDYRKFSRRKHTEFPPSEVSQKSDHRTYNYAAGNLKKLDSWSVKTLAERYFMRTYHTWYEPAKEFAVFVPGASDCDVSGCNRTTAQRVVFNVCGTVYFADVCATCARKYHRKMMEDFPWKNRGEKKVV